MHVRVYVHLHLYIQVYGCVDYVYAYVFVHVHVQTLDFRKLVQEQIVEVPKMEYVDLVREIPRSRK